MFNKTKKQNNFFQKIFDFLKRFFLVIFKRSSLSFEILHQQERLPDGSYVVPYSQFKNLQRRTRVILVAGFILISLSVIILIIYFPPRSDKVVRGATVTWDGGGDGSTWSDGDNWDTNSAPGAGDSVIIDTTVTVNLTAATTIGSLTLGPNNNPTLNFSYDATSNSLVLDTGNLVINSNSTITHTTGDTGINATVHIQVQSGNATVTGTINTDGKGYDGGALSTDGSGTGSGQGVNNVTGSGAGHGGTGGDGGINATPAGGSIYGSTLAPTTAGSGGGGGNHTAGGDGGGIVHLDVSGTLTVNGNISADAVAASNNTGSVAIRYCGGGGAGGSIYIMADEVAGTGTLSAQGGKGGDCTVHAASKGGGGGAGGRLAVYFNTPGSDIETLKSNAAVLGGVGGQGNGVKHGYIGEVGTLFFLEVDAKDLEIYNGKWFFLEGDTVNLSLAQATFTNTIFGDGDATTNDQDVDFDGSGSTTQFNDITIEADAYVTSEIISGNSLFALNINTSGSFIINSAVSSDASCRTFGSSTSQDASFDTCFVAENITITAADITINEGSQIFTYSYGNSGGAADTNGSGNGGGTHSTTGGGGGHGGAGGAGADANATGGSTHGSNTAPITAGSGGAGGDDRIGGRGGGIIKLEASGNITIDGTVNVDGENGQSRTTAGTQCAGGGAGGSIYIITTATLAGASTGKLLARGGNGGSCTNAAGNGGGGGGGGGRVATYYLTSTYAGSTAVNSGSAGSGNSGNDGQAGSSGTTYTYQYVAPNVTFDNDFSTWNRAGIIVNYNLIDADENSCNISQTATSGIEYSLDNSTWVDASEFTGGVSEGFTGLASSASPGENRQFVWASATDLPTTQDSTVYLRLRPNDGTRDATDWVTSDPFGVDNVAPSAINASTFTNITTTSLEVVKPSTVTDDGSGVTTWRSRRDSITELGDDFISIGTTTVSDSGLSINTQYTYNSRFKDTAGNTSGYGTSATVYTLANEPGTSTVDNPAATSLDVTINENSNPSNTEYAIQETNSSNYVQSDGSLDAVEVWKTATNWGTSGVKKVSGLSANTSYTFKVKARNGDNTETIFSTTALDQTKPNNPGAPTLVNPSSNAETALELTLDTAANPASTRYEIYETTTGQYVQTDSSLGAAAVWQTNTNWGTVTIAGLSANVQYSFKVRAINDVGDSSSPADNDLSAWGSSQSIYTKANVPGTPSVSAASANSLTLTIDSASNPSTTEYAIYETTTSQYVQTDSGILGSGTTNIWQTNTSWGTATITGLSADTQYTFQIKAKGGDNLQTSWGDSISRYTLSNTPGAVTSVSTSADTLIFNLDQNNNPATTEYAIYETITGRYLQTGGILGESAQYQSASNWTDETGVTVSGLSANVQYSFKVQARNGDDTVTSTWSETASFYTLAVVPRVSINSIDSSGFVLAISEGVNSSGTAYAIYETTTSQYVQADSTLGASAVWQDYTTWNGPTLSGLSSNVSYNFQIKARNADNLETSLSDSASSYTAANVPGVVSLSSNQVLTILATLDVNSNPALTEFAIFESSTSQYVQASGILEISAVWQTYENWGGSSGILIENLNGGTTYSFQIKARNTDNVETELSTAASEEALAISGLVEDITPPAKPSNVSLKLTDSSQVEISWQDPADSDLYRLYILRGLDHYPVSWPALAIVTAGSRYYLDATIEPGHSYKYLVKARDITGNFTSTETEYSIKIPAAVTKEVVAEEETVTEEVEEKLLAEDESTENEITEDVVIESPKDKEILPTGDEVATDKTELAKEGETVKEVEIVKEQPKIAGREVLAYQKEKITGTKTYLTSEEDSSAEEEKSSLSLAQEDLIPQFISEDENKLLGEMYTVEVKSVKKPTLRIELDNDYLKIQQIDKRKLVIKYLSQDGIKKIDLSGYDVKTPDGYLESAVAQSGYFGLYLQENVNKWSEDKMFQMELAAGTTNPGVYAEVGSLPDQFVARATENYIKRGSAYNLITIIGGVHNNKGQLNKEVKVTLRYDSATVTNESDLVLQRYDPETNLWETPEILAHDTDFHFFHFSTRALGVYAVMEKTMAQDLSAAGDDLLGYLIEGSHKLWEKISLPNELENIF